MNEERVIQELVEELRRRREDEGVRLDERWERLAAGTLSEEEKAELEVWAQNSEEGRRMWALCQPVSPTARQEIFERIRSPKDKTSLEATESMRREPDRRVSGGSWWRAPATVAATVVATATVAAVLILWPGGAPLPLPEYSVELSGGVQMQRSPDLPSSVPVFETGTRFELTLRPQTRVEGPLEVRGFLSPADGSDPDLEPWLTRNVAQGRESQGRGAVILDGIVGQDVVLRPGEWDLWLVIARTGVMPKIDDLEAHLARGVTEGPGWVVASPTRSLQMRER